MFQSVANVILSRELVASDYGIAGFAMICVGFMKTFSGFGINNATVHAQEFDEKGVSTAFTLRQILGLLAFIITVALSGFAEHFVEHAAISSIIKVLAFAIIVDNFSLIPTVLLARELRFSVISMAEAGLTIVSSIIAICLVHNGFKYWSIIYSYLAANIVYVIITNYYVPCKFKFGIDVNLAKQYLGFGLKIFLTGLLSFAVFNLDNFIIGSVAGVTQLGFYVIAFNWGAMVCSIMGAVVFSVLFPTFSRMQGDVIRMKQAYLKIIQYTAMLSFLCNLGLFCVADNFLVSVLGKGTDKWLPSLLALRIFCFYGILRSLIEPASSLLMAQGHARIPLKAGLLVTVAELTLVYPAIKFGSIEIVSLIVLVAYTCQVLIYLPALRRIANITAREVGLTVWPAIIAGMAMLLCYFVLDGFFPLGLMKLTGSILFLSTVYLVVYGLLTHWRVFFQLRDLLPGR